MEKAEDWNIRREVLQALLDGFDRIGDVVTLIRGSSDSRPSKIWGQITDMAIEGLLLVESGSGVETVELCPILKRAFEDGVFQSATDLMEPDERTELLLKMWDIEIR